MSSEIRPFPVETPFETILREKDHIKATWNMLERFIELKEDGITKLLRVRFTLRFVGVK